MLFAILLMVVMSACNTTDDGVKEEPVISEKSVIDSLPVTITNSVTDETGQELRTVFKNRDETVMVYFKGDSFLLKQVPMASGIRYTDGNYTYAEWQGEIEFLHGDKRMFYKPGRNGELMRVDFVDDKGKPLTVVYNTAGEKPTANITYDDIIDKQLKQTSSWAKGADYEGDGIKWSADKDKGELSYKGKSIKFRAK